MRDLDVKIIKDAVAELSVKANTHLRMDVIRALIKAYKSERKPGAKRMLGVLIENAKIAKLDSVPVCQDTGMAVIFVEAGQDIHFKGGSLVNAINEGVREGYKKGFLRKSVVNDPILRVNTKTNTPAIIHFDIVPGDKVKITVLPKGFGSENKSSVSLFLPTVKANDIEDFVLQVVKNAGPDACPPYVIGIGLGGTLDKAVYLSKKALLGKLTQKNPKKHLASLEKNIMARANKLNIGVMGLSGKVTVLGVKALSFPTHIAGCPVAVNISCHALRSAVKVI